MHYTSRGVVQLGENERQGQEKEIQQYNVGLEALG